MNLKEDGFYNLFRDKFKSKFLILLLLIIFLGMLWNISRADTIAETFFGTQTKNFGATGIVFNIDQTNIYLEEAKGSDDPGRTSYTLDLSRVIKVESNNYDLLSLGDIKKGDKVIVQGQEDGGNIYIKRIISFGNIDRQVPTDTTDLSPTKETEVLGEVGNIPVDVSTTSESNTASSTVEKITDKIVEIITDILDKNSTSTDDKVIPTEDASSTSAEITGASLATTSSSTSQENSEESSTASSSSSVIDSVVGAVGDTIEKTVDAVGDVVQTVVDVVTGSGVEEKTTDTTPVIPVSEVKYFD